MFLPPKGGLATAKKRKSTYDVSGSSDKKNITTLFTFNAADEFVTAFAIFKYERLSKVCMAKPAPYWAISKTDSG